VRVGRKARLARLSAAYNEVESEAAGERSMLRFYAATYPLVREAMLRAGIDPAQARALREVEAKLAGFVDTPALQRADAELAAAEKSGKEPVLIDDMDPHDWLEAHLDAVGRRYKESGTLPNLWFASFMELLGWATPPDDAEDAVCDEAGEAAC
jgi:hypothetical protein